MFNSNQCWDGGSFVQSLENCYYKMKSWEDKAVHAVTTHIFFKQKQQSSACGAQEQSWLLTLVL